MDPVHLFPPLLAVFGTDIDDAVRRLDDVEIMFDNYRVEINCQFV